MDIKESKFVWEVTSKIHDLVDDLYELLSDEEYKNALKKLDKISEEVNNLKKDLRHEIK